jgi:thiol:disulfide interchange protein DsbD
LLTLPAFAFPGKAKITATVAPTTAHPGEVVTVTAEAQIEDGWHIYSIVPVPDGPLPTELTVASDQLTPEGNVTESATEKKFDEAFKKEVAFFSGKATFSQALKVKEGASGTVPVKVSVKYQACDASGCQPPKTEEVLVTLTVEPGAVRAEYAKAGSVGAAPVAPELTGSLWDIILTGFGAGLLALLTPCVFPMIPVTLAFFTKQATQKDAEKADSRTVVKLATTYAAGIVLMFTALGAVLAVTIGAAGANRFAQHPITNLVFAILFIVFGLAMLEVIEIRPPRFLEDKAGQAWGKGGTAGVLLMGLTFVVTAFTCTAPFVGSVLVAAANGAWFRPIVGMLAFAAALALPFLVLAFFPTLLAKMPKSGAWMTTIKGAMGFIELAAALKFLSNADLSWKWNLLSRPLALGLMALILLAGGAWLLGVLKIGINTPEGKPTKGRIVWAALFAALGAYCLYGLTGRPLSKELTPYLPPVEESVASGEVWFATLEEAKIHAAVANKPIFVDFTGHT